MKEEIIKDYETLLLSEICEVTGCTEPASIAYACARAMKFLKKYEPDITPKNIFVRIEISKDVYRNTSTVKVPILKLKGIKPAVICGLFGNDSEFNPFASIKKGKVKEMMSLINIDNWISVIPLEREGLYVDVEIRTKKNKTRVIIEDKHDRIKKIVLNKKTIYYEKYNEQKILKIEGLEQIKNIVKKRIPELEKIAEEFLKKQGRIIKNKNSFNIITETERLIRNRMEGGNLPVITITGSGNQGIFLSIPFYKLYNEQREKVIPSFLFAILTQIFLTQKKGRISSMCGLSDKCAPSLVAGLSFLKGKSIEQIRKDMEFIEEVFRGLLCEGAQRSCAYKGVAILEFIIKYFI